MHLVVLNKSTGMITEHMMNYGCIEISKIGVRYSVQYWLKFCVHFNDKGNKLIKVLCSGSGVRPHGLKFYIHSMDLKMRLKFSEPQFAHL